MRKFAGIAIPLAVAAALVALIAGCGSSSSGKASSPSATTTSGAPNYANSTNWVSLPSQTAARKKVDVFYLIDTVYSKPTPSSPYLSPIKNPAMVQGAKLAFSRTATVFEKVADIYAPYFRQIDSLYRKNLPIPEQLKLTGGVPTSDATSAFDYYIKHYNKGRPFILAGHSQGSNVTANILADYMKKNPKVYKRMVAAYVIGYSITPQYLSQNPELKFAEGPTDTGVIVSYNTEAPVIGGVNPVTMPGGIAINPITWTRGEEIAPAALNAGSLTVQKDGYPVLDSEGNEIPLKNYADAQVNKARGVVICSTADVNLLSPGSALLPKGVYHSYDYPFYYFNLRANADARVAEYMLKNK
ncbi:MAG TPA: DUF3089 domain-containing protein [Candidatus Anoxymicrobiaceae bacterium]